MKILTALTYYKPYISGLTIYAARVAEAWVKAGHEVTVLTSQHQPDLPLQEEINGVHVVREPVLIRISKGAVMPQFWKDASAFVQNADVVNIHLPQLESALLARLGRKYGKKVVLTYHCDLQMPGGLINAAANAGVLWMNDLAGKYCDAIVTNSGDYADHSAYLEKHREKVHIIQPPVVLEPVTDDEVSAFRKKQEADRYDPIIGMACRFAADKGVEVLLDAMPKVLEVYPKAAVFFMGPYEDVLGEKAYYERLKPRIDELIGSGHWRFMGKLPDKEVSAFYHVIDVLAMPSLNRTDSFGLVQIEAMICGKPVAASNLPGVRVPVTKHDMGAVFAVGDEEAMAESLIYILRKRRHFPEEKSQQICEEYSPAHVAGLYEQLFINLGAG